MAFFFIFTFESWKKCCDCIDPSCYKKCPSSTIIIFLISLICGNLTRVPNKINQICMELTILIKHLFNYKFTGCGDCKFLNDFFKYKMYLKIQSKLNNVIEQNYWKLFHHRMYGQNTSGESQKVVFHCPRVMD